MQTVLHYLSNKAVVITPNNRLSATLLEDFFKQKGTLAVEKPSCLPYRTFLTNCYKTFIQNDTNKDHPLLLNDIQCQYLWREILHAYPEITYSEGLLTAVMDAWNNCQLWLISPNDIHFSYTPQTEQFQIWWLLFEQKLKALHAITEQQILNYLLQAQYKLENNALIWVCFDSFTPQQKQLQTHLSEQGIEQIFYDLPKKSSVYYQFEAKHAQAEQQQLIAFLRQRLALGETSIGVVVPDLQQQAQSLHRILLRHLEPELFNISLGKTLKDYPLVSHALHWLALDMQEITNHQAKLLLHSPYLIGSQSELQARAQFMQENPLLQKPVINFKIWINALKPNTPLLATALQSITGYPMQASLQSWVGLFKARLETLGFPGEYGLHSENYQCFNSFMELLDVFSQLGVLATSMTAYEALSTLKSIAAKTIFQPQTTPKPIQVLGLLEASGCQFQSLWVMGLTDQCLPQKADLSPFIPHELQRGKDMPHSLPARELQLAIQVLQRLQNSTDLGVFSYPALLADSPNLPSPLIIDFPILTIPDTNHEVTPTSLIKTEESYLLPLKSYEKISGGTALLSNQAKCPFKAFAAHRLHAKPAPDTTEGMDARDRGKLIHQIMENIWRSLGSQAHLLSLSEKALEEQIEHAIINALSPYCLTNFMQKIEFSRLKRLVIACLNWEKERPPFTIEVLEEDYTIQVGALEFKVRVDRLDKSLEKKWVIDYKSSLPTNKPWKEERPKEPQLLLYALLDDTINTLLFIELKAGNIAVSGFSEDKLNIEGITHPKKDSTWIGERDYWRQQLNALADEFSSGFHPPQPIDSGVCALCDFQNLCRFSG